jgi:cytochrome c553
MCRCCAAIVVLLCSAQVLAAPSSNVAWTAETEHLINSGDPQRGRRLAYGCTACHGTGGLSVSPAYPHIDGQDARYLYKQLHDFRDQTRSNPQMTGVTASLSEQDMADIAVYYASRPGAAPVKGSSHSWVVDLVRRGAGARMVPACSGCHGPGGEGNPGYYGMPVLAGQKAVYLAIALRQYRAGTRANDVYGVMRAIAEKLTDSEITALGKYYATQDAR